jgi:hypothetical protein
VCRRVLFFVVSCFLHIYIILCILWVVVFLNCIIYLNNNNDNIILSIIILFIYKTTKFKVNRVLFFSLSCAPTTDSRCRARACVCVVCVCVCMCVCVRAGALSRSGWMPRGFASTSSRSPASYHSFGSTGQSGYGKRHLAALARLGWLPSFRNPHSFYMRNGRGSSFQCDINKRTLVDAATNTSE